MISATKLDREMLEAALTGFEHKRAEVGQRISEIRVLLGIGRPQLDAAALQPKRRRKRGRMSAEARKRIGDAARKRWAEVRRAKRKAA